MKGGVSSDLETGTFTMPDGRTLHLYGAFEGVPAWPADMARVQTFSHRRWHPVRREWVVYSAHRQTRTYKPAAEACPFCPHADGELPVKDFSVGVFDNRFSSLQRNSPKPEPIPGLDIPVDNAAGQCEVIVYSSDHRASMASLSTQRRELLVRVWADRVRALMEIPSVQFVMPFENRGEEAGVTLHHPHGQIYAFSYIPPIVEKMVESFREGYRLDRLASIETYAIASASTMSAFVPPFARFPYEVWVAPKRAGAGLLDLSDVEVADCAALLGRVADTYDTFFGRVCPYVMIVYAAPRGMEAFFPFHIQFYPLLRTPDRLKYLAGCELGAGSFLVDVLPEAAAKSLRDVKKEKTP